MQRKLEQIVLCQSKYQYKSIYIRIESEDVFVSTTADLSKTSQVKFQPNISLSQKLPLRIEIWNYEPHKMLRSWYFQSREMISMKNKHMISQNNWVIYLKKTEKQIENKQNKLLRGNKSRSTQREMSNFKMKVNESKMKTNKMKRQEINLVLQSKNKGSKDSIKKTLKNTIRYLIKQQSLVNNFQQYGMQDAKSKLKTAKCTPASEQISNVRGYSTIFSEYGLNMTDQNSRQSQPQPISLKLELRKKVSKPR